MRFHLLVFMLLSVFTLDAMAAHKHDQRRHLLKGVKPIASAEKTEADKADAAKTSVEKKGKHSTVEGGSLSPKRDDKPIQDNTPGGASVDKASIKLSKSSGKKASKKIDENGTEDKEGEKSLKQKKQKGSSGRKGKAQKLEKSAKVALSGKKGKGRSDKYELGRFMPTISPTSAPTKNPAASDMAPSPTLEPTRHPTAPSVKPTPKPTLKPTKHPTSHPTEPSFRPTTMKPIVRPTTKPTLPESDAITDPIEPTVAPTCLECDGN